MAASRAWGSGARAQKYSPNECEDGSLLPRPRLKLENSNYTAEPKKLPKDRRRRTPRTPFFRSGWLASRLPGALHLLLHSCPTDGPGGRRVPAVVRFS